MLTYTLLLFLSDYDDAGGGEADALVCVHHDDGKTLCSGNGVPNVHGRDFCKPCDAWAVGL